MKTDDLPQESILRTTFYERPWTKTNKNVKVKFMYGGLRHNFVSIQCYFPSFSTQNCNIDSTQDIT